MRIVNPLDIPADLPPGDWCCRLDESFSWGNFAAQFVTPPRPHQPGDCLVHVTRHARPCICCNGIGWHESECGGCHHCLKCDGTGLQRPEGRRHGA